MSERYPDAEPHDSGLLPVGDGHRIHWETVGDPAGTPALWLHGGPGSGSGPASRRYFDPAAYRAVLMDQRGCGRSLPLADSADADLAANTTQHLIGDIEALREHLGIDRWVVAGASWGVTLGLAYAQQHPDRVRALVLAAVTAGRRRETEWITRDMRRVFPREWDAFASFVPAAERDGDLATAYARLLADPDPAVTEQAAEQWCIWEDVHVSLMPGWEPWLRHQDPQFRQVFARLVTHYWSNGCFLDGAPILQRMDRIAHVPGVLIHGRYDVSGPLDTAWDLHRAWPASRLVVLDDSGHGGGSMSEAIVEALDRFRRAR
jgi:proline iminopeptidase